VVNVASAGLRRDCATYREIAEGSRSAPEPVTALHGDRPSVVIVPAAEFARLKPDAERIGPPRLRALARLSDYASRARSCRSDLRRARKIQPRPKRPVSIIA
jgi:PHD/YefM family antitoxin component YafN of YafNO toxin-antitoxin module